MGVAPLIKVTLVAARSDYEQVVRRLAEFRDYHPLEKKEMRFDPAIEDLAVRAVRLFAQADQVVKDMSIPLAPGMLDVIFRGARVPQTVYEAKDWKDLLDKAEAELVPIVEDVRMERNKLSEIVREKTDVQTQMNTLVEVSKFPANLSGVGRSERLKLFLAVVEDETLVEFRNSLSDLIFVSEKLTATRTFVLIASSAVDAPRVEKTMKALDVKLLAIPENLPQNPAEAYTKLSQGFNRIEKELLESEKRTEQLREKYGTIILAVRELTEVTHEMFDSARMAGDLTRLAVISGYVPARRGEEFSDQFQDWMVFQEAVQRSGQHNEEDAPTLLTNGGIIKSFENITREQGLPGGTEVDPTPLVAFVFPVFFGMMFGDLGHGMVMTAFSLLVRTRAKDNPGLKRWGNIFLAAGVSAMIFGVLFGEFFGTIFGFANLVPISKALDLELVKGNVLDTDPEGPVNRVLVLSLLIGVVHITTGLALSVVQTLRAHESIELVTEKIPVLAMYVSGIGFGLSFIGAKYSFNVFTPTETSWFGVPNSTLGTFSVATVFAAMSVLLLGKAIAILAGKLKEGTIGGAIGNGAIEVFELISRFLANTVSYARLAILLIVHASLLLVINNKIAAAYPPYISVAPLVIFNLLIMLLECLIVYIQVLRLHIYEFFTKFYEGEGTPFRQIFPDKARARISWVRPARRPA